MSYFAVLGRQPELGLAELSAVLGPEKVTPFGSAAVLAAEPPFHRLGGTVKLVQVLGRAPFSSLEKLPIKLDELPLQEGKTIFGISYYRSKISHREVKSFGLNIKNNLKSYGPIRLVTAQNSQLSAAQLKFNYVLERGFELVIVVHQGEAIWGITTKYQDIDAYSLRDFGRPARSAKVGMLPPKLAQILINLNGGDNIYDPFCGTGVILQEALLMGKAAAGSDLDTRMVNYTTTNLEWLQKQVTHPLGRWTVVAADARQVRLPPGCSIASEGYLGPNLSSVPEPKKLAVIKSELRELYLACFKNWVTQLSAGAGVVICLPAWRLGAGFSRLEIIDDILTLGYTTEQFAASARPLIYARDRQVVAREIITLRKI